jgi:hypothetical protein
LVHGKSGENNSDPSKSHPSFCLRLVSVQGVGSVQAQGSGSGGTVLQELPSCHISLSILSRLSMGHCFFFTKVQHKGLTSPFEVPEAGDVDGWFITEG